MKAQEAGGVGRVWEPGTIRDIERGSREENELRGLKFISGHGDFYPWVLSV